MKHKLLHLYSTLLSAFPSDIKKIHWTPTLYFKVLVIKVKVTVFQNFIHLT